MYKLRDHNMYIYDPGPKNNDQLALNEPPSLDVHFPI